MAPKTVKKTAKSKSAAEKGSKNDSEDKRKRQANLTTQLKASEEKKKAEAGLVEKNDAEKAKLDAPVSSCPKKATIPYQSF